MVGLARGVSGIAGADRRVASSLYRLRTGRAPPGRVSWPRRPESSSVFVGRHLVVRNALLREPAAVNTRGVVGGRVGAGAGRSSVDSVDGSPLPSGADTALAGHARLTCVETWRSSGEAVGETPRTIARHSPGAAAPTARSRAGRGCQQVSMWRMGAGSRARQAAAAVVAAAACEQGQESAPRALKAGRLPGNGSIVTHQRYAGHFQGGEFAGPGRNMHNRRWHNTARLKRKHAWRSK